MATESLPPERAIPSGEFYEPITDPAITIGKLTDLSTKATIPDSELFEAIADTFATMATIDFQAGVTDQDGYKALDWQRTDEVEFESQDLGTVFLNYHQQPQDHEIEREEGCFIQKDEGSSIDFLRENNASVRVTRTILDHNGNDTDESGEYIIPENERKTIVKILLEGVSSKETA